MLRKVIVLGLAVAAISGTGACVQRPAKVLNQDVIGIGGGPGQDAIAGGPGVGFGHVYRVIQIESDPPGALVWIDGRRFGTTPQAIRVDDDLSAMLVGLVKQGYSETGGLVDLTTLTAAPCPQDTNALCSLIHADLTPRY